MAGRPSSGCKSKYCKTVLSGGELQGGFRGIRKNLFQCAGSKPVQHVLFLGKPDGTDDCSGSDPAAAGGDTAGKSTGAGIPYLSGVKKAGLEK